VTHQARPSRVRRPASIRAARRVKQTIG